MEDTVRSPRSARSGGRPLQRGLPFTRSDWEARQAAAKKHAEKCSEFFNQLGIQTQKVLRVLTKPGNYWRPVRRESGGKVRVCYSPNRELRYVHSVLKIFFGADWGSKATAYNLGNSIIQNASRHRNGRSSLEVDLKDAFESIQTNHVYRMLLRGTKWRGFTPDQAWVMSRLVTYHGRLRMGAPISPRVFNMAMASLDSRLYDLLWPPEEQREWRWQHAELLEQQIAKGFRPPKADLDPMAPLDGPYVYTRYGDNLCFSHPAEVFPKELRAQIIAVVEKAGFTINHCKTRKGKQGRLFYPGVVVVNGRLQPTGEYVESFATQLPDMRASQKQGHTGFLNQFGHKLYPKMQKRFAATEPA